MVLWFIKVYERLKSSRNPDSLMIPFSEIMSYTLYFDLMCERDFFLDVIIEIDEFYSSYLRTQMEKKLKAAKNG